uniref:Uncharacterized protein n=1 Tax=Zea mays TaxID=4577 RepID=C4J1F9_MAIZE|nr:unknown [Zea mays]
MLENLGWMVPFLSKWHHGLYHLCGHRVTFSVQQIGDFWHKYIWHGFKSTNLTLH